MLFSFDRDACAAPRVDPVTEAFAQLDQQSNGFITMDQFDQLMQLLSIREQSRKEDLKQLLDPDQLGLILIDTAKAILSDPNAERPESSSSTLFYINGLRPAFSLSTCVFMDDQSHVIIDKAETLQNVLKTRWNHHAITVEGNPVIN